MITFLVIIRIFFTSQSKVIICVYECIKLYCLAVLTSHVSFQHHDLISRCLRHITRTFYCIKMINVVCLIFTVCRMLRLACSTVLLFVLRLLLALPWAQVLPAVLIFFLGTGGWNSLRVFMKTIGRDLQ